ncbi:unnamed protein product [Spirodela intermedia]|uniref:HTH La-type RNA-binding domain-containing protein n=1 Tax=Spirodela intermedia TaxID=51605 RepID=A0ABN7E8E3_SPIIN|nr:unnamed protein product [Spirodela intermedia]
MAGFHGRQGFHRRHAHRQWGPPPSPPHYGGFSGYALPPPYLSPFTSRDGAMAPPSPCLPLLLLLRVLLVWGPRSEDNLARNVHLKMQMDEEGWVSVHTIASFPRVKRLTNDVVLILRSLQPSPTVEVEDLYAFHRASLVPPQWTVRQIDAGSW